MTFSSGPLILTVSQDSPLGVRFSDFITPFPASINDAASFNRGLIRTRWGEWHKEAEIGKDLALKQPMKLFGDATGWCYGLC